MGEFISTNYLWIILVVIVIVMAIIGYYADKTDFGRKKIEKVPKKKKEETEVTEPVIEPVGESSEKPKKEKKKKRKKEPKKSEKKEESVEDQNEESVLDSFPMIGDTTMDIANEGEQPVMESVVDPVDPVDPLMTPPVTQEADPTNDTFQNPVSGQEDLFAGLDGTPNVFRRDEKSVDELNATMPDLDTVTETQNTEDVWKF